MNCTDCGDGHFRLHLQRNQTRYRGKAMNPKATHRVFGEVKILAERVTDGGNKVVDAICTDNQRRVLLTNEEYWENGAVRSSTAPSICGFSPWLSLILMGRLKGRGNADGNSLKGICQRIV
jgi:hypothetical protein